jgi:streptogramin lyase
MPRRSRRGVAAAVALALVAGGVTAALAAGPPVAGGLAAVAPDHVAAVDAASGRIVAELPVGAGPGPVVAHAGVVYVGNRNDASLSRVDTRKREVLGTRALGHTPTGLAWGAGSLWLADGPAGTLSRLLPGSGLVARTTAVAGSSTTGSVAVGHGAVWGAFGDATLAALDARSLRLLGHGFAGRGAAALAFGAGTVWVVSAGDRTLYRFDPSSFVEGAIHTLRVGRGPSAVAVGARAAWVANAGDGTLTRVDPLSSTVSTVRVGGRPVALAAGGGAVWVAGEDGTVTRVDPGRGKVTKRIALGNPAAGIAVSGGLVWVTVRRR